MPRSTCLHHRRLIFTLRYPIPPYLKISGGVFGKMLHCSLWPGLPFPLARTVARPGRFIFSGVSGPWPRSASESPVASRTLNSRILVCMLQSMGCSKPARTQQHVTPPIIDGFDPNPRCNKKSCPGKGCIQTSYLALVKAIPIADVGLWQ